MKEKMLNDELLSLVSGGVLLKGWDNTLFNLMKACKAKFGEAGYKKIRDSMEIALNDPTSPIEKQDMQTLYKFIDENWDKA